MKKLVALILMSGFVGTAAQATVGRNESPRVDCAKVIQTIQEQLKRNRPAGEAPRPENATDTNTRPAT